MEKKKLEPYTFQSNLPEKRLSGIEQNVQKIENKINALRNQAKKDGRNWYSGQTKRRIVNLYKREKRRLGGGFRFW